MLCSIHKFWHLYIPILLPPKPKYRTFSSSPQKVSSSYAPNSNYPQKPFSDFNHYRLVLPIIGLHNDKMIFYVFFSVWLVSSNMMFLKFIHDVTYISVVWTFLLLSNILPYEYTIIWLSILLLMDIEIVSSLSLLWVRPEQHLFF